jgi:hypothetical protein
MLEIDLQECRLITDASVIALIHGGRQLRELRLAQCNQITDDAFLSLPPTMKLDTLRILDLTACHKLTDAAVEKIIDSAPRLRILVLAKCISADVSASPTGRCESLSRPATASDTLISQVVRLLPTTALYC